MLKNISFDAGGIKFTNLLRTLHGSVSTTGHALDGVAIVSDIVGSTDPLNSSRRLCDILRSFKNVAPPVSALHQPYTPEFIKASVSRLLEDLKLVNPLVHQVRLALTALCLIIYVLQLTNIVVANQSANATLALGASPIMATAPEEMEDLSRVIGALLVNFGTIKDKDGMLLAGMQVSTSLPEIYSPLVDVLRTLRQFKQEASCF